jgi:hypothetical protein
MAQDRAIREVIAKQEVDEVVRKQIATGACLASQRLWGRS